MSKRYMHWVGVTILVLVLAVVWYVEFRPISTEVDQAATLAATDPSGATEQLLDSWRRSGPRNRGRLLMELWDRSLPVSTVGAFARSAYTSAWSPTQRSGLLELSGRDPASVTFLVDRLRDGSEAGTRTCKAWDLAVSILQRRIPLTYPYSVLAFDSQEIYLTDIEKRYRAWLEDRGGVKRIRVDRASGRFISGRETLEEMAAHEKWKAGLESSWEQ